MLNVDEQTAFYRRSYLYVVVILCREIVFLLSIYLSKSMFSIITYVQFFFLYQNTCSQLNLLTICQYIVPQSSEITLSLKNVILWLQTWRVLNVIYTYLIYSVPSHISNFHRTDEIFCFHHFSQCFVNYTFKKYHQVVQSSN